MLSIASILTNRIVFLSCFEIIVFGRLEQIHFPLIYLLVASAALRWVSRPVLDIGKNLCDTETIFIPLELNIT